MLQLTAFGARDRGYCDSFCGAPWRQLKRMPLDGRDPCQPFMLSLYFRATLLYQLKLD